MQPLHQECCSINSASKQCAFMDFIPISLARLHLAPGEIEHINYQHFVSAQCRALQTDLLQSTCTVWEGKEWMSWARLAGNLVGSSTSAVLLIWATCALHITAVVLPSLLCDLFWAEQLVTPIFFTKMLKEKNLFTKIWEKDLTWRMRKKVVSFSFKQPQDLFQSISLIQANNWSTFLHHLQFTINRILMFESIGNNYFSN